MTWHPATETNAMELFEVPCLVNLNFYGSLGDQARVYADVDNGIAVEILPEDREQMIKTLSKLLDLMKEAK